MRDPLINPRPGDIVRGVAANPRLHAGTFSEVTVEAVCGNLIAVSFQGSNEIIWRKAAGWCAITDPWISHWEVLHVQPEPALPDFYKALGGNPV